MLQNGVNYALVLMQLSPAEPAHSLLGLDFSTVCLRGAVAPPAGAALEAHFGALLACLIPERCWLMLGAVCPCF